jgi:predicted membrane GTPase involved in stress response
VTALDTGIRVEAIWEPDVDALVEQVERATGFELLVSEPEVHYILGPRVLEPILKVEASIPEELIGAVCGDMNRRRGAIQSLEVREGQQAAVVALIPLASLFGYKTILDELTGGQASVVAYFHDYWPGPSGSEGDESSGAAVRA